MMTSTALYGLRVASDFTCDTSHANTHTYIHARVRTIAQVMENSANTPNFGYNAAIDAYQDLLEAGIIDPTKVSTQGSCATSPGPSPPVQSPPGCCFERRQVSLHKQIPWVKRSQDNAILWNLLGALVLLVMLILPDSSNSSHSSCRMYNADGKLLKEKVSVAPFSLAACEFQHCITCPQC